MTVTVKNARSRGAVHDPERRGILIPTSQLEGSPFRPGDRFALRKGQREFFSIVIEKSDEGDILFEKWGIFIPRTRRVDAHMGGIFHAFSVEFPPRHPDRIQISPVDKACQRIFG